MWNRVVGQIGQAWNQNYPLTNEQEETGVNGVSSTQSTGAEGDTVAVTPDVELTTEQYRQVILAKDVRDLPPLYVTIYGSICSRVKFHLFTPNTTRSTLSSNLYSPATRPTCRLREV